MKLIISITFKTNFGFSSCIKKISEYIMKLELYDTFYRVHVFPKSFRDFISFNLSLHFKIPELLIKENRIS